MSNWDIKTAEWYAEKYGDYATNKIGVSALKLPEDSTVVDIGCGTGCALRHASEQVTKGALIGIDPVYRMVEIAKENTINHEAAERIRFYQGAAEKLPVNDDIADFVFAFDSFDHWHDKNQGLKEVRRILKPNGHFVVVKDGGLPHGSEAKNALKRALDLAGFELTKEEILEEGDVNCTLWVCLAKK
ncbi:MAG: class I SAM-dependent methyltransferase [Saccharospirillaceae bacterium]|nr:class I SAM-dependent methyltransferase [Saccharospirillaceae bacterium]MCD8531553.1 class I SAM-dependent methyltransferase [Saccharospirillaceae bacterium]